MFCTLLNDTRKIGQYREARISDSANRKKQRMPTSGHPGSTTKYSQRNGRVPRLVFAKTNVNVERNINVKEIYWKRKRHKITFCP